MQTQPHTRPDNQGRGSTELNWLESMAIWILSRSERILSFTLILANGDRITVKDTEPPSMTLERIYHQPSYGEEL